eukprot:g9303.t1
MAPEIIRNEKYSAAVDIWAFGVIAYELLLLELPFNADSLLGLVYQIANTRRGNEAIGDTVVGGNRPAEGGILQYELMSNNVLPEFLVDAGTSGSPGSPSMREFRSPKEDFSPSRGGARITSPPVAIRAIPAPNLRSPSGSDGSSAARSPKSPKRASEPPALPAFPAHFGTKPGAPLPPDVGGGRAGEQEQIHLDPTTTADHVLADAEVLGGGDQRGGPWGSGEEHQQGSPGPPIPRVPDSDVRNGNVRERSRGYRSTSAEDRRARDRDEAFRRSLLELREESGREGAKKDPDALKKVLDEYFGEESPPRLGEGELQESAQVQASVGIALWKRGIR